MMGISRLIKYSATSLERGAALDRITRPLSNPSASRTFLKTRAFARVYPNGFEFLLYVIVKTSFLVQQVATLIEY